RGRGRGDADDAGGHLRHGQGRAAAGRLVAPHPHLARAGAAPPAREDRAAPRRRDIDDAPARVRAGAFRLRLTQARPSMTIKSDRWIKRMAREHGMIEPFEPDQVRMHAGQKVVSYGVSSYGYDVRCADEFKIITNINTTIVDPKHFDEKSFVDFRGECCIIPPNSFALARTVEYFRIPENV